MTVRNVGTYRKRQHHWLVVLVLVCVQFAWVHAVPSMPRVADAHADPSSPSVVRANHAVARTPGVALPTATPLPDDNSGAVWDFDSSAPEGSGGWHIGLVLLGLLGLCGMGCVVVVFRRAMRYDKQILRGQR